MNGLRTVACLALLLVGGTAMADKLRASQTPDQISVGGLWREWLLNRPLTPYLYSHPRVMPQPGEVLPENARGYVAEWKIVDDRLYLKRVVILTKAPGEEYSRDVDVLPRMFPGASEVFADWYSGALVVQTFAGDYTSTAYRIVPVTNGIASAPLDLTEEAFEQYRARKFAAYKKTDAYRLRLGEFFSVDPDYPRTAIDEFLYNTDHERYLLVADSGDGSGQSAKRRP